MGTTAQKLQAVANSKAAIKAAIEAKGVTEVGDILSEYATKIASIPSGGSGDPRYEVSNQGALRKKSFAIDYFDDVTSIPYNGLQYAYYGSNVTSASFPNLTSVGQYGLQYAFQGCTSLTSVDLSKVTSVGYNGFGNMFSGCTSLRTVLLNKLSSANNSFSYAFQNCSNLELVDFSEATAVPALNNTNAFDNTNNYYRIVVPNALYNQWITATNWSNANIVTHIEKAIKALMFKAGSANSTISLDAVGTPTSIDIEYSTDGGVTFSPYTVGTTVTLTSVDDEVMFRAGSTGQSALADDSSNYHKFVMSGSISLEDDVSYLLDKDAVPSTTALADYAFYGLFNGCASLQNAPELPWTALGEGCYGKMFQGCTSLQTAPELPATTLATGCYNEMFYGCSSLNNIIIGYTGNFSTTYFNDWVYGVAATGTFNYAGSDTTTGTSAIPTGWTVPRVYHGLTFIAESAGSTVAMKRTGSAPTLSLEYSTDDGQTWNDFTVASTTITLTNIGDECCIRAKTTNAKMANSYNNGNIFNLTGQVGAYGDATFLLDKNGGLDTIGGWALGMLFWDCTALTHAPELPSHNLGTDAYDTMFTGCSSLREAPELPATNLGSQYCYSQMFSGCTSLTKAPFLPATVLQSQCYGSMFKGCTNLSEIKIAYTGSFSNTYFYDWVQGVAASGTFYYNGSDTTRGTNAIPSGWTIQTF